jgi:hypothetical protein
MHHDPFARPLGEVMTQIDDTTERMKQMVGQVLSGKLHHPPRSRRPKPDR